MASSVPKAYDPVYTAVSCDSDPEVAARELHQGLNGSRLSLVLFFCSPDYDQLALAQALDRQFASVPLVGCTTAGEITPLGYRSGSITAIGFCADHFSVQSALLENLADFSFADAQLVIHDVLDRVKESQVAPLKGHSFALTLLDGLAFREEQLLSMLKANLGSIPLLGGSAGDDLQLQSTYVYYQGRFYSNAAILLLVNTRCDFEVFSIDHLQASTEKLVVTAADSVRRRVTELNATPAALEYARSLGLRVDQLNSLVFALNPLGVRIGDRYYPRAIQKVNDDRSLSFHCAVETGIVLTRCRSTGLVEGLETLFAQLRSRLGAPSLVIGYECILRRLELEDLGQLQQASKVLEKNRVIGFSTYGEQFDGIHLNHTFTGVALGGARV